MNRTLETLAKTTATAGAEVAAVTRVDGAHHPISAWSCHTADLLDRTALQQGENQDYKEGGPMQQRQRQKQEARRSSDTRVDGHHDQCRRRGCDKCRRCTPPAEGGGWPSV